MNTLTIPFEQFAKEVWAAYMKGQLPALRKKYLALASLTITGVRPLGENSRAHSEMNRLASQLRGQGSAVQLMDEGTGNRAEQTSEEIHI